MQDFHCKYCPEEPAAYYCEHCDIGFCLGCVPDDSRSTSPRCTLCRKHLSPTNAHNVVPAFWTQASYFMRIVFSPSILTMIAFFSIVGVFFVYQGLAISIWGAIYWGVLLMMLFELANLLGEGRMDIPSLQEIWDKGEPFLLVRLLFQVILVNVLLLSVNQLWFTLSLLIIYGFGFPASVIILALEKRFFSAINPLRILYIITAIRAPYLILYGTWLSALALSVYMFQFQQHSNVLFTLMAYFLSIASWTFWFAMLGYVTYQYHQQLGIAIAVKHKHQQHQKLRKKSVKIKSAAVKEAEILVTENRSEDALNVLKIAMAESMVEMDVHRFYLKLLVNLGETKRLSNVSRHLVRQFIHQQKYTEAVQVAVIALENIKQWQPDLIKDSLIIATGLMKMSRREEALTLLQLQMSKNEDTEVMADIYWQSAKLQAENFNQDALAIDYLQTLLTDYPNHPLTKEAEVYRNVLLASIKYDDQDKEQDKEQKDKGDALIIN